MIKSEILAHSVGLRNKELITFVVTFPRIILAELNTHRMFSRNSASSRAIPFDKMVKSLQDNPFIPIAWQKDHKGMQGTEYETDSQCIHELTEIWLDGRDTAINTARMLHDVDVTKQLCNRMLEPYMYHTCIITTSKPGLENFFDLRCPSYGEQGYKSKLEVGDSMSIIEWLQFNKGQAEIHMMALAESMYDAYKASVPERLEPGDWHVPYSKQIIEQFGNSAHWMFNSIPGMAYVSSVMCARVSYTVPDTDLTKWTFEKYMDKAIDLSTAKPLHASPFEHPNKAMNEDEYVSFYRGEGANEDHTGRPENQGWCRNFQGFIQLRHIIENAG